MKGKYKQWNIVLLIKNIHHVRDTNVAGDVEKKTGMEYKLSHTCT